MDHIAAMDTVCASLAFIDGLGAPEMVLIFIIVLVLFGGQKMPEFARGLGKTIREFKKAATGVEEEFKRALEEDERKNAAPQLTAATTPATEPATTPHDPAGPDPAAPQYDEYHDYHHDYQDGSSPETNTAAPNPDAPVTASVESTAPAGTVPVSPPAPAESSAVPPPAAPDLTPPDPHTAPKPPAAVPVPEPTRPEKP